MFFKMPSLGAEGGDMSRVVVVIVRVIVAVIVMLLPLSQMVVMPIIIKQLWHHLQRSKIQTTIACNPLPPPSTLFRCQAPLLCDAAL